MADKEPIRRNEKLLAAEIARYFGETCPALATRWEAAIVVLAPAVLREFAGRLQTFEALTETNHQLRAARLAAAERHGSAEPLLDRALASLEHLDEVAKAMMRRIDALLGA